MLFHGNRKEKTAKIRSNAPLALLTAEDRASLFLTAADKPPSASQKPPCREVHLRLVRVASSFTRSTTPYTRKRNSDVGLLSICLFLRLALLTAEDRASLFLTAADKPPITAMPNHGSSQVPKSPDGLFQPPCGRFVCASSKPLHPFTLPTPPPPGSSTSNAG